MLKAVVTHFPSMDNDGDVGGLCKQFRTCRRVSINERGHVAGHVLRQISTFFLPFAWLYDHRHYEITVMKMCSVTVS